MTTLYNNWANGATNPEQYAMLGMIERAEAEMVTEIAFDTKPIKRKTGRSAAFSRWGVPATNTTAHAEGINNAARNLVPEDVFCTVSEYSETFSYSSLADDTDPRDYAEGAAEVGHDLVKLDNTALNWALMIGGTQKFYNSSSVTQRTDVNGPITAGRLEKAYTLLRNAKAKTFAELQLGSNKIGSSGIMPSYLVFGSEYLRGDFRNCAGFKGINEYPGNVTVSPFEVGAIDRGRIILSPELTPVADAGATVGSANLRSTTGTSADVFPIVVVGKNALGHVPLKGDGKYGSGNLRVYLIKDPDRTDPANLTRLWTAAWTAGRLILNELWIARIEVACTNNHT